MMDDGKGITSFAMDKEELEALNRKKRMYAVTWSYVVRRGMEVIEKEETKRRGNK